MLLSTMNIRWYGAVAALCCLLFIVPYTADAQNLVPNPSFEVQDSCYSFSGFYLPSDGPLEWYSAGESADFFQACGPYGADYSSPLNHLGFQYPQDGGNYVGLVTYAVPPIVREYTAVQLLSPLVVGQTYYASFFANAAWGGTALNPIARLASSKVGMRFSMVSHQWVQGNAIPQPVNYAQVFHSQVLADTAGWTLVSGSFVADSAYQYVLLGNHFDNLLTDTLPIMQHVGHPIAYTYIDNVCVSIDPNGCPLSTNVNEPEVNGIHVFPNPAHSEIVVSGLTVGTDLSVHDALGRKVWEKAITVATMRWSVAHWSRGSYVLHVEDGGHIRPFKFVLIE